jgi:4-amino-4-deoxy-L-arabinose transferase-like glycosyltransferase
MDLQQHHRKWLWRAFLASLLLQVAAIGLLQTYRFRTADNHFGFGWEMGCIGRAIASGRGFSDPFCIGAGPTAWEPPVYPYLIGAVFRFFGIYSMASAWMLLVINSLFSALTCFPIYASARRMMSEKIALTAAWVWALLPYAWYWAIHWIWDTTISPFLLAMIIVVALDLGAGKGGGRWTLFGLLWGVAALLNPSLIAFLPCCGLWIWWQRRKPGLESLYGFVLALVVFLLCLAPWLIRNYRTFGLFIFVRDNLSHELRLGNGPGATGASRVHLMPNRNAAEMERLRQMGEMPYLESQKLTALAFIRENPGTFLALSVKKLAYYWMGVPRPDDGIAVWLLRTALFLASSVLAIWGLVRALRLRLWGAGLLGWLFLSYPMIYYLVYPHARYRHPLEPSMILLIVFLVLSVRGQKAGAGH